jgi:hypothetical protein
LRTGEKSRLYTEFTFQAVDFPLELNNVRTKYAGDRQGREYHSGMRLVVSALLVGPDSKTLSTFTGTSEPFIARVSHRMQSAGLWKGAQEEIEEWGEAKRGFMSTLFVHACIAQGRMGREIRSHGEIGYWDWI